MIDIREHGGSYGVGKYRKGTVVPFKGIFSDNFGVFPMLFTSKNNLVNNLNTAVTLMNLYYEHGYYHVLFKNGNNYYANIINSKFNTVHSISLGNANYPYDGIAYNYVDDIVYIRFQNSIDLWKNGVKVATQKINSSTTEYRQYGKLTYVPGYNFLLYMTVDASGYGYIHTLTYKYSVLKEQLSRSIFQRPGVYYFDEVTLQGFWFGAGNAQSKAYFYVDPDTLAPIYVSTGDMTAMAGISNDTLAPTKYGDYVLCCKNGKVYKLKNYSDTNIYGTSTAVTAANNPTDAANIMYKFGSFLFTYNNIDYFGVYNYNNVFLFDPVTLSLVHTIYMPRTVCMSETSGLNLLIGNFYGAVPSIEVGITGITLP